MALTIDVDLPTELNRFRLPKAVAARLQAQGRLGPFPQPVVGVAG